MNKPDYKKILQADNIKRLEEENKELSEVGLESIKILCQYIINLKQKLKLADKTIEAIKDHEHSCGELHLYTLQLLDEYDKKIKEVK